MGNRIRRLLFFFGLIFLVFSAISVRGQFVNFSRAPFYKQVFAETDDFDSSYLTILEKGSELPLPDSVLLAMANDLAYYWHTRNLDKAYSFAQAALGKAVKSKSKIWEGRILVTLGAILLRQERLDSAMLVLESARTRLPKSDWPLMLTQMGYVYERRGQLSRAADYALEGLKLGEELGNDKARAMAYSDLSNLFWKQSKFEKGIEYGLISEKIFMERGIDDMDYSFTLYVIGNNYMALKDNSHAMKYYSLARVMSDRYQFYNNLADIYISLADLNTNIEEYVKAEADAKEAIRYSALLDNNFMLMRSWLSLAKLQNLNKQPDSAIRSLGICLETATENFGDKYFLHQAYQELGKAYASVGNFKNAYAAFLKHDALEDSVFTIEADQRVATLQTEFEVAQKESTILSQQQSISQQKRVQWLTLGATGLLIFILVFLYRNYQNKRRVNSKLETLNQDLEQKNIQLDKRIAENELLLKEIHHRVKNNLEIVSGLLALQAAQIDHPSAQAVMQASQNRVLSMGIIHQKLYQKGNLAAIEMKDYFRNLSEGILDTFNAADRITIECPMEPIELDVDTAVPVGLIANELLTNALKYAFGEGKPGCIKISLTRTAGMGELEFKVSDNGAGKPESVLPKGSGFGTELVNLLVQQLGGKMKTVNDQGMHVSIRFTPVKSGDGIKN